jgi:hypothetical protein
MEWEGQETVSTGELETVAAENWEVASVPFVGRWNQLISTTNWEKGRIISQWRAALRESGSPATEYSDDSWSRRVGGVTGQHVGRLRRVYERFGEAYADYAGLHWSHFHAAMDWDDAEMWLEGAVQSRWSVSQMRNQRWETTGRLEAETPHDEEIVTTEMDEDFVATDAEDADAEDTDAENRADRSASAGGKSSGPLDEGPDFGDDTGESQGQANAHASGPAEQEPANTVEYVRPFQELGELPSDLAEAFDAFKLAILHHKLDGWQQVSSQDVLASLDALKQLVVAPSDETAPF